MSRLRETKRTATIAWSPFSHLPALLATGTVSGTMDASFSSSTELEIWSTDAPKRLPNGTTPNAHHMERKACVSVGARFNKIEWSGYHANGSKKYGIIAGALDNGALEIWDAAALLENRTKEAHLFHKEAHKGPVRALHFNTLQPNLLASGSNDAEISIWDLAHNMSVHAPSQRRSAKLDTVTALAWNCNIAHILASGAQNGNVVIWDVRSEREIIALSVPGGSKRDIRCLAWNPEQSTQIMTVSEDDQQALLRTWDLRNANRPLTELQGHARSPLYASWHPRDVDLLLSSGQDNVTYLWNPHKGEIVSEIARSENWVFECKWSPANPDLFATASYDGKIRVYSISASTPNDQAQNGGLQVQTNALNADPFANINSPVSPGNAHGFSLPQPPKWLRRPCGAVFGFGSKLYTFEHHPPPAAAAAAAAAGNPMPPASTAQAHTITVKHVPSQPQLAAQMRALKNATKKEDFQAICDEKQHALQKEQGATMPLAVQKDAKEWRVVRSLLSDQTREDILQEIGLGTVLDDLKRSVAEAAAKGVLDPLAKLEQTFNKSAEPVSEAAESLHKKEDRFPTLSLLKDTVQGDLNKAILMGDWELAVQNALKSQPTPDFASALLFASCGGPELFARVQEVYCRSQMHRLPSLRVVLAILRYDLLDIVENGDVNQWTYLLGILCSFARPDDFTQLCSALAARLSAEANAKGGASLQEAATLVHILAGDVEQVVAAWHTAFASKPLATAPTMGGASLPNRQLLRQEQKAMAQLHALMEKTTVLRQACAANPASAAEEPKKGADVVLHGQYFSYALMAANQGEFGVASHYLQLIEEEGAMDAQLLATVKDRVYHALEGREMVADSSQMALQPPPFPFEVVEVHAASPPPPQQPQASQPSSSAYGTTYPSTMTAYNTNPYGAPANAAPYPSSSTSGGGYAQTSPYAQSQGPYGTQPQQSGPYGAPSTTSQQSGGGGGYNSQYAPQSPTFSQSHHRYPAAPTAPAFRPSTTTSSSTPNYPATNAYSGNYPANPAYGQHAYAAPPPQPPQPQAPPPPPQPQQPSAGPRNVFMPRPPQHHMPSSPPAAPPVSSGIASGLAEGPVSTQHQAPKTNWNDPPVVAPKRPVTTMARPTPPPPPPPQVPTPHAYQQQQQQPLMAQSHPPVAAGGMPGRGPVASPMMHGQPSPMQQPQQPPPPPAPPAKPRYPPGDRSHIPKEHTPIVTQFSGLLTVCKTHAQMQQKKIVEDSERRFNSLFDRLNHGEVNEAMIAVYLDIAKALAARDLATAQQLQLRAMTSGHLDESLVGLKRIIEMARALGM